MNPLITSTPGVLAVCCGLIMFALWGTDKKILRKLGPAMICIIGALILANTGIVPKVHDVYNFMSGHVINLSIAILMLDVNLKKLRTLSFQPFAAMLIACGVITVITLVGGIFTAPSIGEEGWKVAGMFVGTYTGGSPNLNAIAVGLDTSADIIATANAADYVIYTPFIILIMWAGSSLGSIKAFRKLWPYAVEDKDLVMTEGESGYMKAKEWSIKDIASLVTIGFAVVAVSTYIFSFEFISPDYRSMFRTIAITTIGIILAQTKTVHDLRGKGDLGLYLSLFYLVSVGASIDLVSFANAAVSVVVLCVVAVFLSLLFHLILCRFFKIRWQYVLLSMLAAIGSSSSAAALAAGSGWETLVSVGVLLGVFGNAVGNYLGFAVAYAVRAIVGM